MKREYGWLFEEVRRILTQLDPIHIAIEEVNPDEYEPEVSTILPRLREADSAEDTQRIIHEEFVTWFSPEDAGPLDAYELVGRQVWDAWLRHATQTNSLLSEFEQAIMEAALAGDHPVLEALREQFRTAKVKERLMTGAGFFLTFEVDRTLLPARISQQEARIGDVGASVRGLEHGVGFLLWITAGYLDTLEGYSYDEPWPERVKEFEIHYESGGPRDLNGLDL